MKSLFVITGLILAGVSSAALAKPASSPLSCVGQTDNGKSIEAHLELNGDDGYAVIDAKSYRLKLDSSRTNEAGDLTYRSEHHGGLLMKLTADLKKAAGNSGKIGKFALKCKADGRNYGVNEDEAARDLPREEGFGSSF